MNKRIPATLLLAAALSLGALSYFDEGKVLAGNSTNQISISGRVTAADCPVAGPLDLVFEIHDAATGNSPLFTETHTGVQVNNGIFNVSLGSTLTGGVPVTVFTQPAAGDRFVAVRLGAGGPEIVSPRLRLSAVPFALHSLSAPSGGGVQEINGVSPSGTGSFLITAPANSGLQITPNGTNDGLNIVSLGILRVNGVTPNVQDLVLTGGTGIQVNTNATTGETTLSIQADGSTVVSVNGQTPNASGDLALSVNGTNGVSTSNAGNAFNVTLDGGVVQSINSQPATSGNFTINAGSGINVAPGTNSVTISATGGGGGVSDLNGKTGAVTVEGTPTGGVTVDNSGATIQLSLDLTQAVKSFNGKTGNVNLTAGTGVTVDNSGANVVVALDPSNAVQTVNGESGAVQIIAGTNVTVDKVGTDIRISSTGGGGSGTVQSVGGSTPDVSGNIGVNSGFGVTVTNAGPNALSFAANTANLDTRYARGNDGSQSIFAGTVTANINGGSGVFTQNLEVQGELRGPSFGSNLVLQPAGSAVVQANNGLTVNGPLNVFGSPKNFVEPHPTDPTKEIVYCALEGPECAMYARGKARLRNGKVTITLPEHFAVLAVANTMTVHLTPKGDCKGLYVKSQSPTKVRVRESQGGTSNVRFNYMVYAVRKGQENHQPIRPKSN